MNVIDRLDAYLMDGSRRERRSHYPSDVNSCLRQLYYKWNNIEPSDPPTPGNMLKMRAGEWAEKILAEYLDWEVKNGTIKGFDQQVEITGIEPDLDYKIHGYQDFVIESVNGNLTGIECKSSFGRGIVEIQKKNIPKEDHILQVYQYMLYGEAKRYYIVYLARDSGYRTQFELVMDADKKLYINGGEYPIDWRYYVNRLIAAEHTIGAAVPPDCEYNTVIKGGEIKYKIQHKTVEYKSDWQCNYCAWRSLCWKEYLDKSAECGTIFYGGKEI